MSKLIDQIWYKKATIEQEKENKKRETRIIHIEKIYAFKMFLLFIYFLTHCNNMKQRLFLPIVFVVEVMRRDLRLLR